MIYCKQSHRILQKNKDFGRVFEMEHTIFSKSFRFRTITLHGEVHNDNSSGIACHFLARMKCGSGRIVGLDGEAIALKAGDVFYLPLGLQYHSYWKPDADSKVVSWESYGFVFLPEFESNRYKMQILPSAKDCGELFDRLSSLNEASTEAIGLLYRIMGILLPDMEYIGRGKQEALLQTARKYLKEHPNCKMSEVAKACCISESGLYALFRDYAGTTPIKEKNRMQIEAAIELLRYTDFSVEQISESLHFSSAAYFRKLFKEEIGKSPTQVRREQALKHTV